MPRNLPLAEIVGLLFEYAELRGISAAYRTIAVATGENTANIRKIRHGENLNPGLRTLTALASYFGVGLDYFLCKTSAECEDYLNGAAQRRLHTGIAKKAAGISEDAMEVTLMWLDFVRRAEKLPPLNN